MRHRSSLLAALALAACRPSGPRPIEIIATNYAFQVPDSVPAGPVLFTLVNHGTVGHEVQIGRFRAGIRADSGLRLLMTDDVPDSLFDNSGAVLITSPGTTTPQGVRADLRPGELWLLVCQFQDSAGAPSHDKLGMFKVLTVTAAP